MKCPICRQEASSTLKLIYDIKFVLPSTSQEESKDESNIKTTEQIIQENITLKRQTQILQDQIKEMVNNYNNIQSDIENYISLFKENDKTLKQYKNQVLKLSVELSEEKEMNAKKEEEINKLKNEIDKLEKIKKELELSLGTNKEMNELIKIIDKKQKDVSLKEQYLEIMKKNDGGRALSEYFYVLQSKIEKLQSENEDLKKKNTSAKIISDMKIINTMIPHKRKYVEYVEESKVLQNENKISKNAIVENKPTNTNNNTTVIKLFSNPLKCRSSVSFLNKK